MASNDNQWATLEEWIEGSEASTLDGAIAWYEKMLAIKESLVEKGDYSSEFKAWLRRSVTDMKKDIETAKRLADPLYDLQRGRQDQHRLKALQRRIPEQFRTD